MRLVTVTAKRYKNFGLAMEDLMGEGVKGLIRATDLFDVSRGWKFSSYAPLWIRQTIGNALERAPMIYIPSAKRQLLFDLNKNLKLHNLSLESPIELIASTLGLKESHVLDLICLAGIKAISYDQLPADGRWSSAGESGDVGDSEPLLFDQLRGRDTYNLSDVSQILEKVSQQEATILDMKLNLTGTHPKFYGFDEISKITKLSTALVISIYSECLLRLRSNSEVLELLTTH